MHPDPNQNPTDLVLFKPSPATEHQPAAPHLTMLAVIGSGKGGGGIRALS